MNGASPVRFVLSLFYMCGIQMNPVCVVCMVTSSSCHQTIFFHSSAHYFHTPLNIIRPSKEQGCASWKHCNMCAVVSSAFPQEHVVSPV